ncbi:acetyl-CoA carboxylase biotin carboxyl carrier protein [Reyranella aquatilis]|uniref:Biotin carboxyl carrier protein of acetyl-CoA carboxylase n=1 Tax=Reyranella aquatilis TaxID=2035356 RepID=A0ABS8KPD7_9HYPH|nr:acetyl-CoA carboxylase biotin carboxyl carrier protein [Reyranella aquatilis]MCC8427943.1 acetyl-CoA carboxylase biotin carboxyl carrier protein [Reyranella aquatilis]
MAKFELDTEFVRKLAAILEETKLGEIELADGERRIRVARPTAPVAPAAPLVMAAAPAPAAAQAAQAPSAVPAAASGDPSKHPGAVKSPMVGTAYLAPEPGKPNFVSVGDKVAAGQTLLIIEAMKTFNPIKAPKAGTVMQVLIENARPVEFGEPLMIVE